ncbi:hypothetical protein ACGFY9_27875 [Streptomyces sp. NPDC048504]|uniref:hypothetical protein n=1 Tax=Streptomyces sp. NPDC048504 TaxID=3365559 RepID=UPI00371CC6C2
MSSTPPDPKSGAPSARTDNPATGARYTDVPPTGERHPEPTPAAPGVPATDTTADPACVDDSYSGYEPL